MLLWDVTVLSNVEDAKGKTLSSNMGDASGGAV